MWAQLVPRQNNPIDEVTIEGASQRQKAFQSLTIEEGRAFLDHLTREPFHTIALVCLCFVAQRGHHPGGATQVSPARQEGSRGGGGTTERRSEIAGRSC
jgi:hypothetical protein